MLFKFITRSDRSITGIEVDRWRINGTVDESTMEKMKSRLRTILNTHVDNIFITWFDGVDYCSIHDADDLKDAVEVMLKQNIRCLRIFASVSRAKRPALSPCESSPQHITLSQKCNAVAPSGNQNLVDLTLKALANYLTYENRRTPSPRIDVLRKMGFQQRGSYLRKIICSANGDLNTVIDLIEAMRRPQKVPSCVQL
ncbi:hypothetical protein EG68_07605 [Paragonimus skrjabini miyazakii]|uniref:Uncharacterized protein n=1 Tax=Paragonimus skrjabini miyazakii TaxID=59628 RepID=A0A8S9YYL1_9TREM|nr:hypothetical protein EG68_07605 [Paragonimus skrjabini miyazakii]